MKPVLRIAGTTLLISLSGCAKGYGLAPPVDSEKITVTIKVAQDLKAETMLVMYRSPVCTFTDHTGSGVAYKREGYQKLDLEPVRVGESDLYEAKLPVDGGGTCRWRLSNVTFGVVHKNPSQFGEDVIPGAGGGVVVVFDHNKPSRSGPSMEVDGDLVIRKDYYPWVKERFLGGHVKRVSLMGAGDIYIGYEALHAKNVYFEPVFHSGFILRSVEPKKKIEGDYTVFTLPDGSVIADGRSDTKFHKLQAIRKAAEAKQ
ncbi:hypothetical protein [Pseudomonas viridiflava]|uniref:hypothetical protein n=1 Tax=Pseudomonas viridiflava TaxID=33069 RepID=UPI000F011162|nr:hypothetical protein [Pseudomonas viridiflava]MEE4225042.1 hypothetical protein [Pseudomonas viridiflava]